MLCFALVGASAPLSAQSTAPAQSNSLPALGDPVSADFGVGVERRLGDQIMREIRRDPDYADDPLLLEYIDSIFQPLVSRARASGQIDAETDQRFAWEAFLVRDRSVNAFALPGGFIGVHLGLIAVTANRDELASVLAHELSHITQRHIARGLVNNQRQSLLAAAAMIVGVIAAARSPSTDAANAVIAGGQAAAIQGQLNFSRDMEREADRIGFSLLTGAGFAPQGMASMFEKLEQAARLNDSGGYPYLRSHPLTSERIGDARARVPLGAGAAPAQGQLEHAAARGRARVLMDTRADSLRRWQADDVARADAPAPERLAAAISSALASTLLRDFGRADAALKRATEIVAESGPRPEPRAKRAVAMLAAQIQLARGDAAAAQRALEPFARDGSRAVTLLAAQIANGMPAAERAARQHSAEELQTLTALNPRDATAWQLLGRTWTGLDQPLRALRAEAEARVALADTVGAIDRLRAGRSLAQAGGSVDHIEAAVIDARLRDLEARRRAEVAEERGNR
jgi:predicted Zn-dependent protease